MASTFMIQLHASSAITDIAHARIIGRMVALAVALICATGCHYFGGKGRITRTILQRHDPGQFSTWMFFLFTCT